MVSKRRLGQNVQNKIQDSFWELISRLAKKQDAGEFFNEFFTPTEKIMFAKRLAIAVLLAKEYDYRSIEQILKVTSGTVKNVNYWIKHSRGSFRKFVDKILEVEKKEETWHNFWNAIESSTVTWTSGNWSLRRRRILENDREFRKKHPY